MTSAVETMIHAVSPASITGLTTDAASCAFTEILLKTVIPNMKNMYRQGGHHFNYCTYNNQTIIATDIFEIKLNYIEVVRRILDKITKK